MIADELQTQRGGICASGDLNNRGKRIDGWIRRGARLEDRRGADCVDGLVLRYGLAKVGRRHSGRDRSRAVDVQMQRVVQRILRCLEALEIVEQARADRL